ncbi:hypothetical protein MPSEU_000907200 [Mayamaea pseudoterrestris]|nr:hypothetical protein MPSEU_000907200 [Mayamaea pseudoterrestris]
MVGVESADITQNDERFDDAAAFDDDWQLPLDFHLFANFVPHKVYYSATSYFTIDCVESLTPIDMTSLSSGAHDATGLCAWRGAFLLVAMMDALQDFVTGNRNVLELGSGTGVGGIALLKAGLASTLCFSDADPAAIQLCRRNCITNNLPLSS